MAGITPEISYKEGKDTWEYYSEEQLGMTAIANYNEDTGATLVTTYANPKIRTASLKAWIGARHSRAEGSTIDILHEINVKNVDADKKMDQTVLGYGHKSVAELARIDVHFNNVPMHVPLNLFNLSAVYAGQEKSTRYQQRFKGAILHPLNLYISGVPKHLEEKYSAIGKMAAEFFEKKQPPILEAYEGFFTYSNESQAKKLFAEERDQSKEFDAFHADLIKSEKQSLKNRVLDTVRFGLLLGQSTGLVYSGDTRDFGKNISHLKSSKIKYYRDLGEQIRNNLAPDTKLEERLGFKAESPSLLKYCDADYTLQNDLKNFKNILQRNGIDTSFSNSPDIFKDHTQSVLIPKHDMYGVTFMQYLIAANPGMNIDKASEIYDHILKDKPDVLMELSSAIFKDHNRHKELPEQIATATGLTLIHQGALGELRDFNRHRAWGRFMADFPLINGPEVSFGSIDTILSKGYTLPSYVLEIGEFDHLEKMMIDGLDGMYEAILNFSNDVQKEYRNDIDAHFMINLFPLAQKSDLWTHGDIKQLRYFTDLRRQPGGHINYIQLAYDSAVKTSTLHPLLSAMMPDDSYPHAGNRESFFSRK